VAKIRGPPKLVMYRFLHISVMCRILHISVMCRILHITYLVLFLRIFCTGEKRCTSNQGYLLGFPSWYLTRPRILIASAALVVTDQLCKRLISSALMQT